MSGAEYRVAVLRTQLLPAVFEPLQAFDDVVLAEGAALAADASGVRFGDWTFDLESEVERGDLVFARSLASVALLRVVDELAWTRIGESSGFYPHGAQEAVAEARDSFEGGNLSVELYEHVDLYMRMFLGHRAPRGPSPVEQPDLDAVAFLTELTIMREVTSSPEVVEAVRLVQFAGDAEWRVEMGRVWALAQAFAEGSITTLPLASLDAIRWALTGIDDVLAFNRFDALLPSMLLSAPRIGGDRLRQLGEARAALADAAVELPEGDIARGSLRLSRALDQARRTAEGLIDWSVATAASPTTRLATGAVGDKLQVPPKEEQRKWREAGSSDDDSS